MCQVTGISTQAGGAINVAVELGVYGLSPDQVNTVVNQVTTQKLALFPQSYLSAYNVTGVSVVAINSAVSPTPAPPSPSATTAGTPVDQPTAASRVTPAYITGLATLGALCLLVLL